MFLITEESLHDIAYFRLENDTYKKLTKVHNSTIGHLGVEKMLTKLKRGGEGWKGMRIDCKKFIYQCSCCQKMSALKYPIHVHPYTKASYTPMDRIAIDTIGPLPADALGNKYIITIIDCFSRIVELVPAQDTTAITAANAILQWICRYGIPSQIVSDNGTQYSNELVTKLCQLFEIDQSLIQAYSHEENAIVERANKEVGRHLRAIVHDRKILDDWSPMLPLVQRIMNSQIHESIGVSPLQLMYGNSLDMDRLLVMPTAQVQVELDAVNQLNDQRYADWTKKLISQQSNLLKVAMETQLDSDLYHIQRNTNLNKDEITEFPINSYVLQRYEADGHKQPNKLKTPLRGPHKVIGKHTRNDGPDVYTVQNLTNNKLEDFKVNDLRPFNYDPERVNPTDIALTDSQAYIVELISNHKGNPNKRKDMTFKVKWKNYDDETWEPWEAVKDNIFLHQYLTRINLQRLIPTKFRKQQSVLVSKNLT